MKKILYTLILILPVFIHAQSSDLLHLMEEGKFDNILQYTQNTFGNDTNNSERLFVLYKFYEAPQNPQHDSLLAYQYLIQYNKNSKKQIIKEHFAKSLLSNIYAYKSVEKFNKYIELTEDYPQLNKEAQRIRNQLAYEKTLQDGNIDSYKKFLDLYPNAVQTDEIRGLLNEGLLQHLVKTNNIDSLKVFAETTDSESYKKKAKEEIDKLSFRKALQENTVDSYVSYMNEFPNGNYIAMAKTKMQQAQYNLYVNQGNIADMAYYLTSRDTNDSNWQEVFDKLKLIAWERYSLFAMKTVNDLKPDDNYLDRFAKRYVSDNNPASIENLLTYFPFLAEKEYVITAEKNSEILVSMLTNPKLSMEDYKKHKNMFSSLSQGMICRVFALFDDINSQLPKSKSVDFHLNNDYHYLQYINAKSSDLNFILTEKPEGYIHKQKPEITASWLNARAEDLFITSDNTTLLFSMSDTNGYDWYEGSENKDIYVSFFKNNNWTEPILLNSSVNSRFNETHPVLSEDKKTLWFSSDRDLNFGKLDIYVCYRKDTNDWDNWSEPVLLSEDFNTKDDDFAVMVTDSLIILSQDAMFSEDNNIYLEGNINQSLSEREIKGKDSFLNNLKVQVLDSKTMKILNIVRAGNNGLFAFLKPEEDYILSANIKGCFIPVDNQVLQVYDIKEIKDKQILITLDSPFDKNSAMTTIGKKNLQLLAETFKTTDYMISVGVHAIDSLGKMTAKDLSDKQANQIFEFLVKAGMDKDNIIVSGYGADNIVQGWENKNSIDIGVIQK